MTLSLSSSALEEKPFLKSVKMNYDTDAVKISPESNEDAGTTTNLIENGRVPSYPNFDVVEIDGVLTTVPDVNVYQHKKTLAQGMMDLALLSANANQLRYILDSSNRQAYFYISLIMITVSIFLQVAVGIGLFLNSRYNVKDKRQICHANRINNFTVIGIFIITAVNVMISAFGTTDSN